MIELGDIVEYDFMTFQHKAWLTIRKKGEPSITYGCFMVHTDYEKRGKAVVNAIERVRPYEVDVNQITSEVRALLYPGVTNISIEDVYSKDETITFMTDVENYKIKQVTHRGYLGVSVMEYTYSHQ